MDWSAIAATLSAGAAWVAVWIGRRTSANVEVVLGSRLELAFLSDPNQPETTRAYAFLDLTLANIGERLALVREIRLQIGRGDSMTEFVWDKFGSFSPDAEHRFVQEQLAHTVAIGPSDSFHKTVRLMQRSGGEFVPAPARFDVDVIVRASAPLQSPGRRIFEMGEPDSRALQQRKDRKAGDQNDVTRMFDLRESWSGDCGEGGGSRAVSVPVR